VFSLVAWWQGGAEPAASDREAIGELLEPHALVRRQGDEAGISLWQRDEERYLRNALRHLTDRAEALESANADLLQEKEGLEARLEVLEPLPAQLEQLDANHRALLQRQQITASALKILEQERVDSARQLEHWRQEWDQAQVEGPRLRQQEVQLHGAIRAAQAEAEQWRVRLESCQGDVKALGAQLDDLRRALDAGDGGGDGMPDLKQQLLERLAAGRLDADRLAAERDQLIGERDRMATERDQIAAEHTTSARQLDDLQRQKQALEEQMQQLADKVSRSESELEILKTMMLADAPPTAAGALA
jgi:DNA repair exonuclease SbcCD ATPase subunit